MPHRGPILTFLQLSRSIKAWFSRKRILRFSGAALLLSATIALWPCRFYYDSVCAKCGTLRYTTVWQLPYSHSDFGFFKSSTESESELSSYLKSSGQVRAHKHDWQFGHGGGNGVRCAIGGGDELRSQVKSKDIPCLLEQFRR